MTYVFPRRTTEAAAVISATCLYLARSDAGGGGSDYSQGDLFIPDRKLYRLETGVSYSPSRHSATPVPG